MRVRQEENEAGFQLESVKPRVTFFPMMRSRWGVSQALHILAKNPVKWRETQKPLGQRWTGW